jgi:Beta-lactamase enzyme family
MYLCGTLRYLLFGMERVRKHVLPLLLFALLAGGAAAAPATRDDSAYLATIRPSAELQEWLDQTFSALAAADPKLRQTDARVALLDLSRGDVPLLAERRGEMPIYPASVVKFVYLMAAYAWQENGTRSIDPEMDGLLTEMIHHSSNQATRGVFARLTATEPGPELKPGAYEAFRDRRLSVNRWLQTLGITDLHCVNPTYDGDGDLFGRDKQFVSDRGIPGARPGRDGEFANRNAMTAVGTAKLLALLATDRALTVADSATVRRRMHRDPVEQPYLAHRIAGGAARLPELEVYSKSGTWGPIFADAGIVRHASGRQLVLVVFTTSQPAYRGDFIADLTYRCAQRLLTAPPSG